MTGFDPRIQYEDPDFDYNNDLPYDGFSYPGPNNTDWIVEVAFDLSVNGFGDWFTLDDPVKGVLDNSTYLLAGDVLVDVTRWVRRISTRRGRSRRLDKFVAGTCEIVFDNTERLFDPFLVGGPFYGQLTPRKEVRVRYRGQYVFVGNVEDWRFAYDLSGDAITTAACVDAMAYLSRTTYTARTETSESSTTRIGKVLNAINWDTAAREIGGTGTPATLYADTHGDVSALKYMQDVESSDLGKLFITKEGLFHYEQKPPSILVIDDPPLFGDGGIPFSQIGVQSEADRMVNRVEVTYAGGTTTTFSDSASQAVYGQLTETYTTLLLNLTQATTFANTILDTFSQPNYYLDRIIVNMRQIPSESRTVVLSLDLADYVALTFRPRQIGAPQEYTALAIDSIAHTVTTNTHFVEFGLSPILVVGGG